ncbi:MAG: recombinase family protein [Loktanella sp.]|nr:recombinase family protein [Loktanella sp.]
MMAKNRGQGISLRQRVVGYLRVSTKRQGESGVGLETQEASIRAFADHMGWELIDICRDVASGVGPSSMLLREGLQNAIRLANENDAFVLAHDWSRISRDTDSFDKIAAKLPSSGHLVSAVQGNTMAEAAKAAQLAATQQSVKAISDRTKKAMDQKSAEGASFGNPDIRNLQPKGTTAYSEEAADRVRLIAEVLKMHAGEKLTRGKIAQILNDRGILTGQNQPWTVSRVTDPLRKARALIAAEEEQADDDHYKSNPNFGLF